MKYKIPVTLLIETENYEDGEEDMKLTDEQLQKVKKVTIEELDYLLEDSDFLHDVICERLPGTLSLVSLHVEKENEKVQTDQRSQD